MRRAGGTGARERSRHAARRRGARRRAAGDYDHEDGAADGPPAARHIRAGLLTAVWPRWPRGRAGGRVVGVSCRAPAGSATRWCPHGVRRARIEPRLRHARAAATGPWARAVAVGSPALCSQYRPARRCSTRWRRRRPTATATSLRISRTSSAPHRCIAPPAAAAPPPPPPRLSYLAHNSRSVDESADDLWLRGSSCRRRSRCLRACSTSTSSTRACSSPLSPLSLPAYVRMMRYASACAASARRRAQAATLEPSFRVTAMLYLLSLAGGPPPQAQCTAAPSASPRAFHPRPRPRPRQRRGPHPSTLPRHRHAPSGARSRTRRASGFRWQRCVAGACARRPRARVPVRAVG